MSGPEASGRETEIVPNSVPLCFLSVVIGTAARSRWVKGRASRAPQGVRVDLFGGYPYFFAIAEQLGRKVTEMAAVRNGLIDKGMLFSPGHGDTAFTVPLFDGFMRRIMPAP